MASAQQVYNLLKSGEDPSDPKPWLASAAVFNDTVTAAMRARKKSRAIVLAKFQRDPTTIEQYFTISQQQQHAPAPPPPQPQPPSSPLLDEEMPLAPAAVDPMVEEEEEERDISAPPGRVTEWIETPSGPTKVYFDEDWVPQSIAKQQEELRLNREINQDRKRALAAERDGDELESEAVQGADQEASEDEEMQMIEEHAPVQDFLDHIFEGLQFEDGPDPVQAVQDQLLQGKTPDELMEKYGGRLDVHTRKQMEYDAYFATAYARTVWSRGELLPTNQFIYLKRIVSAFISLPSAPYPYIPHPPNTSKKPLAPEQLENNALFSQHMLSSSLLPLPAHHEAAYRACIRDFDAFTDAHPFWVGAGVGRLEMGKLEDAVEVTERTFAAARKEDFIMSREHFETSMIVLETWDVVSDRGDLRDERGRKVLRWDPTFPVWEDEDEGAVDGGGAGGDGNAGEGASGVGGAVGDGGQE